MVETKSTYYIWYIAAYYDTFADRYTYLLINFTIF